MKLEGARIVVGVSAGIAAYKAADLCSKLVHAGAEVRVMMSTNAPLFVAPLTFEALTGHPVYSHVTSGSAAYQMEHITWAKWANLILIAPASADLIARLAAGFSDDAITTTCLAYAGQIAMAPSMNTQMLQNAATQQNLLTLQQRGFIVIPPDSGALACGDVGAGRMAEPTAILEFLQTMDSAGTSSAARPYTDTTVASTNLGPTDTTLAGKSILITSGPTREYIDPVRFISNPSSGRMGAALAREATRRGATVHLVTGPVESQHKPECAEIHSVTTAEEMLREVQKLQPEIDIFIFAAAVGDFRAGSYVGHKIKRTGNSITLPLVENPDISQSISYTKKPHQLTIGFAAETEELEAHSLAKIERKRLDAIVANDVSAEGIGFESTENEVTMYFRNGERLHIPRRDKAAIARGIFDALLKNMPQPTTSA